MSGRLIRWFVLPIAAALMALAAGPPAALAAGTLDVPGSFPTIQAAIDAAAAGDVVRVAAGTYHESIDFKGKAITVESVDGPGVTIIDAAGLGTGVVRFASGEGRGSVLQGFTIQHGSLPSGGGGGISVASTSPTIRGNVITGNVAACGDGGGIDVEFGSPLIVGNVITGNQSGTACSGEAGGGISIGGAASAEVIGNTIAHNSSFWAGAISLFAAGTPTIANNVIDDNSASAEGGAIWSVNQSDALISQNVFTNNRSPSDGGAIFFLPPSGTAGPLMLNNTFSSNSAAEGSAVYADGFMGTSRLFNNIFVSSSSVAPVFCNPQFQPTPPVLDHNDGYSVAGGPAFAGACAGAVGVNGNISSDPRFAGAADFHLSPGSPAIDAGNSAAPQLPATDLDGQPRVSGAAVDLGAYETQGQPAPGPGVAAVSPTSLDFGTHPGSALAVLAPVTVENTGESPLHVISDEILSNSTDFVIAGGDPCPGATLAPGATCVIQVGYIPGHAGSFTGRLVITTDVGALTVPLTGSAITGHLTASGPTDFGTVHVGRTSKTQTLTIGNDGNAPLHIGALSLGGANPGDFVIVRTTCGGATVQVGATCTVKLAFLPQASGARSALLLIASDDPASPFGVLLTGTGK